MDMKCCKCYVYCIVVCGLIISHDYLYSKVSQIASKVLILRNVIKKYAKYI